MKSTKYTYYNQNPQGLTELLGQLMRGSSSSIGYRGGNGGGGVSRNSGIIRRTATRPKRRPGIKSSATVSARRPTAAKQTSDSSARSSSRAAGQKRNATETGGGLEKKKSNIDDAAKKGASKDDKTVTEDPLLRGLCESGVRWYLRYIKEGLEPKVAVKKAWEHYTEPAEYEPQWGKEFQYREVEEEEQKSRHRFHRRASRKLESNEDYRIAVHPKDFPDQMLDLKTLLELEEAITLEIAKGADAKLQFANAHLRPGALICDCVNEGTVNWLKGIVTKLPCWDGPELTTSQERVIPDAYVMTIPLPKSIGQDFERTLALIAAQNEDLNTEVWKLVNEREENEQQVATIRVDKDSFNTMKRNDWKLYYRFEKVAVHFHRYLRFGKPILWITNPSCHKQNQVKPPGPSTKV